MGYLLADDLPAQEKEQPCGYRPTMTRGSQLGVGARSQYQLEIGICDTGSAGKGGALEVMNCPTYMHNLHSLQSQADSFLSTRRRLALRQVHAACSNICEHLMQLAALILATPASLESLLRLFRG